MTRPAYLAAVVPLLIQLAGCEDESASQRLAEEVNRARRTSPSATPEALMVRFKQSSGEGFSRDGWELEVLQLGGEVLMQGSVRTGGSVVPIYHPMNRAEYLEFWGWLKTKPFQKWQAVEDERFSEEGWRKSLDIDIVLSPDERVVTRNRWRRPLTDAGWVADLEGRLHILALDLARAEIERQRTEKAKTGDDAEGAMREAVRELGDAHPQNQPGASPDGK